MEAYAPYTHVKRLPDVLKDVVCAHPKLPGLLRKAYSAEKAAAFAYQGHAASVKDPLEKAAIRQIELDEWEHRREVGIIMHDFGVKISRWNEFRFHIIGKFISASCHVLGWFMPFYFAGRLESGNVCEYFRMIQYFHQMGISSYDQVLFQMGAKEKEHELFFLQKVRSSKWLPLFEKIFSWGRNKSFNNFDLDKKYPMNKPEFFCKK